MTHDFSKQNNNPSSKSKHKESGSIPGWLWMLAGLLLGALVVFALKPGSSNNEYSTGLTEEEMQIEAPSEEASTETQADATSEEGSQQDSSESSDSVTSEDQSDTTASTTETTTNHFEFYTILTEQEVMVEEFERAKLKLPPKPKTENKTKPTAKPAQAKTPSNLTIAADQSFTLQVGSFQNASDAQSLQSKIQSAGLAVNIEKGIVTRNNIETTWHRVIVGPFSSSKDIQNAEQTLAKLGITSLLMKKR